MHWSSVPLASRMNSTASRASAIAAGVGRDVMGFGLDALACIGHGDGEADFAHGGKIDDVVAHVADFVERHSFFLHDFADGLHFECAALVDELELEVTGASGHGFADAFGDDAALEAAETSQRDGGAVVGTVAFGFDHGFGVERRSRSCPCHRSRPKLRPPQAPGTSQMVPSVRTPSTSKRMILILRARSCAVEGHASIVSSDRAMEGRPIRSANKPENAKDGAAARTRE